MRERRRQNEQMIQRKGGLKTNFRNCPLSERQHSLVNGNRREELDGDGVALLGLRRPEEVLAHVDFVKAVPLVHSQCS